MQLQLARVTSTATVLLALAALLALSATAALAQYPPPERIGVTGPETVTAGEDADFAVFGADDGEEVEVTTEVAGEVIYSEVHTADAEGDIAFTVSIPGDAEGAGTVTAEAGDDTAVHEFTVTDADAEEDDAVDEDVTPVDAEDDTLPVTGGQIAMLAILGLGLVGGGALALRKRGATA